MGQCQGLGTLHGVLTGDFAMKVTGFSGMVIEGASPKKHSGCLMKQSAVLV